MIKYLWNLPTVIWVIMNLFGKMGWILLKHGPGELVMWCREQGRIINQIDNQEEAEKYIEEVLGVKV